MCGLFDFIEKIKGRKICSSCKDVFNSRGLLVWSWLFCIKHLACSDAFSKVSVEV